MKLYNTLTRNVDELAPLDGKTVRIYSCGPTVYDHAHIGNLSAYIFADTLRRALEVAGHKVQHAMNYTDVDDKTIRRSRETFPDDEPHQALHKLTSKYIQVFLDDMSKIGNDISPITFIRATDSIPLMQALITELHEKGFAYIADDGVYFSINAYEKSGKKYGQLLALTTANTSEARIQNDEYDKESVHDFALWKSQKEGEPAWDFELDGQNLKGRPGWHIECSAMSRAELGQPFDIHTGGVDLIFPHHENEIAQSTALESNPMMAHFFAHNDHILVNGKKMAKSAKNFFTLQDSAERGYEPAAFRFKVLQSHYRNPTDLSFEGLDQATAALKNIRNDFSWIYQSGFMAGAPSSELAAYFQKGESAMIEALEDDLNTPKALAILHELSGGFATWPASQLDIPLVEDFADFVHRALGIHILDKYELPAEQKRLLDERAMAREAKDWAKSDELRDELVRQGIGVRDRAHGAIWFRL